MTNSTSIAVRRWRLQTMSAYCWPLADQVHADLWMMVRTSVWRPLYDECSDLRFVVAREAEISFYGLEGLR